MSITTVTTSINQWLDRQTKHVLIRIIIANLDRINIFKEMHWEQNYAHVYTCFHCKETFGTEAEAARHFGQFESKPACILVSDRGLLHALREMEKSAEMWQQRAKSAEDETEILQGTIADIQRSTGCNGAHEMRCLLDTLRGKAEVGDVIARRLLDLDEELYKQIIG